MFVYILFKRENIYVTSHSYPSLATCPTLKVLVRAKPDVILVERPPQSSPLVLYGTKECGRTNGMRVWRGESTATISKPSQYYRKTFSCSVFFFSQPSFSCGATNTYQSSLGWVTWANRWIFWFVIFTVQLFSYENLLSISGDVKGTTLLLLRKKVILKSFSLQNMKQTSKHVDVSLRTESKKKSNQSTVNPLLSPSL